MAAATTLAASAVQPIVVNLMSAINGWLQYTQVIGTLIIALIAAGIAGSIQFRQMRIAAGALKISQDKIKFDLFKDRLAVFNAVFDVLTAKLHGEGNQPSAKYLEFKQGIARTKFLFGKDVQEYVLEVQRCVDATYAAKGMFEMAQIVVENGGMTEEELGDARKEVRKHSDALIDGHMWLRAQQESKCIEMFGRYMDFGTWR